MRIKSFLRAIDPEVYVRVEHIDGHDVAFNQAKIINGLQDAKTEDDLEAVNDLADEAVAAGLLTQEEVDALWDDFAPSIES